MQYIRIIGLIFSLFVSLPQSAFGSSSETETSEETTDAGLPDHEPSDREFEALRYSLEVSIYKAEDGIEAQVSLVQMLVYVSDLSQSLRDYEDALKDDKGLIAASAGQWEMIRRPYVPGNLGTIFADNLVFTLGRRLDFRHDRDFIKKISQFGKNEIFK